MDDAASTSLGRTLPPPDYSSEDDPTLQIPVVIHYDEWRRSSTGGDDNDENFPEPPAEMLADDDEAFPEPPPDYDESRRDGAKYSGLIPPHKLVNPVMESKDRVRINKDIQFNAKHGISVLDTKPELEKEFRRIKLDKQRKEYAEQQKQNRNSLEQKLEQRKEKLAGHERDEKIVEEREENQSELTRIHNRIKAKTAEPH